MGKDGMFRFTLRPSYTTCAKAGCTSESLTVNGNVRNGEHSVYRIGALVIVGLVPLQKLFTRRFTDDERLEDIWIDRIAS